MKYIYHRKTRSVCCGHTHMHTIKHLTLFLNLRNGTHHPSFNLLNSSIIVMNQPFLQDWNFGLFYHSLLLWLLRHCHFSLPDGKRYVGGMPCHAALQLEYIYISAMTASRISPWQATWREGQNNTKTASRLRLWLEVSFPPLLLWFVFCWCWWYLKEFEKRNIWKSFSKTAARSFYACKTN